MNKLNNLKPLSKWTTSTSAQYVKFRWKKSFKLSTNFFTNLLIFAKFHCHRLKSSNFTRQPIICFAFRWNFDMYIKSIEIDGFKSYARRTEIKDFDRLFNAITGLNGSGKSNILDSCPLNATEKIWSKAAHPEQMHFPSNDKINFSSFSC